MRWRTISFVCYASACPVRRAKDATIDELKARFEKARAEDRAEMGIRSHSNNFTMPTSCTTRENRGGRAAVEDI